MRLSSRTAVLTTVCLLGASLPTKAQSHLDVVPGSLSAMGGQLAGARLNSAGVSFVHITLSANPDLAFEISFESPAGETKIVANDLCGRLAKNGRIKILTSGFSRGPIGNAEVRVDLKHPEDFEKRGPWAAVVILRPEGPGNTGKPGGSIVLRLPHGSPPGILYLDGRICWVSDGGWRTVSELSRKGQYTFEAFLPGVSGSDAVLTVTSPRGYRFDASSAEVVAGGMLIPVKLSRPGQVEIRLGSADGEDVYVNLPVLPASATRRNFRESVPAREFQIRLDYENDSVTDWAGHP